MYVCMYVCMYVRMYVCTYVRMYVCTYVRMYVCMYVSMYECMNARVHMNSRVFHNELAVFIDHSLAACVVQVKWEMTP